MASNNSTGKTKPAAAKPPVAKAPAPKPAVQAPAPAKTAAPAKVVEKRADPVVSPPIPAKAAEQVVEAAAGTTQAAADTVRKASDEAKTVVAETAAQAAKTAAPEKPAAETVAKKAVTPAKAAVETVVKKAVTPAKVAAETVVKSVKQTASKDNRIMSTIEETVTKTQAIFGDVGTRAKAQLEKNAKLVEELNTFAKGNVEALVESGKITAKGMETIGQDAADFTRKSFEKATATMKQLSSVKSPADFFKLQSEFVREQFDAVVAATSKNTEAVLKLAGEAAQPISSRYAVAVEKVKTAA